MAAPAALASSYYVRILEESAGGIHVFASTPKGASMEIVSEIVRDGKTMVLRGLHIGESTGPDTSSIKELREIARTLGRQEGVEKVIIQGAERTTGANPGKKPLDIVISVGGNQ